MTSFVFYMAVVAFLAFVAMELAYRVPDQILGLDENSQAYQIGVWSFIVLFIGYAAFYATGSFSLFKEAKPSAPVAPPGSYVGNTVNLYTLQLVNQNDKLNEVFARPQDFKIRCGQTIGEACRLFYGFMLYDAKEIKSLTWCYSGHCVLASPPENRSPCRNRLSQPPRCNTDEANRKHISTKADFFKDAAAYDPRHFVKVLRTPSQIRLCQSLRSGEPQNVEIYAKLLHQSLCGTWHFCPSSMKHQVEQSQHRDDFFFTGQFKEVFQFITTGILFIRLLFQAVERSTTADGAKPEVLRLLRELTDQLKSILMSVTELQRLTQNLFIPGYAVGRNVAVTEACAGVSYATANILTGFDTPTLPINTPKNNNLMYGNLAINVEPPGAVATSPSHPDPQSRMYFLPDPLKQTNLGTILQIQELYCCTLVELLQDYFTELPAMLTRPLGKTITCYDANREYKAFSCRLNTYGDLLRVVDGTQPNLVVDGHTLGIFMALVFEAFPPTHPPTYPKNPVNRGPIQYLKFSKGYYTKEPRMPRENVVKFRKHREDCLKDLANRLFGARGGDRLLRTYSYPHLQRTAAYNRADGSDITSPYHECDGVMLHLARDANGRDQRALIAREVGAHINTPNPPNPRDVATAKAIVSTRCAPGPRRAR